METMLRTAVPVVVVPLAADEHDWFLFQASGAAGRQGLVCRRCGVVALTGTGVGSCRAPAPALPLG